MSDALEMIAVAVFPQGYEAEVRSQAVTTLVPEHAFEWATDFSRAELERAMGKADCALLPREGRRKSVLICDMDSTLIGQECIDELADFAGVRDRVSAITERAMRGELDFEAALRERVGLLKGLPEDVIAECYAERITINDGAKTLVTTMKRNGATTVIVSGGFTAFTAKVAEACGFDHHHANVLEVEDGVLTGRVVEPILGREAKREALMRYTDGQPERAIAIGDGANDLAMIEAAGIGVAYYAKPVVAEAAGCAIRGTDLRTALWFQGYGEGDVVEKG